MMRDRHKLFFWLIVAGGLLSILFHFPRLQLDSDSSVVGLMAKHILQGRNFPVFFYGYGYVSSLKAFLTAPVFWLFGSSNVTLMVIPVILSLIFIILTYQLGRELYNREVGLLSMLFAAIAPVSLNLWYHTPRGAYIETLLFGNIILILTHRICVTTRLPTSLRATAKQSRDCGACSERSEESNAPRNDTGSTEPLQICRGKNRDFILLGFVSGFAWWTNQLILYYLLASAFLIFVSDKKIFLKKKFLLLVLFFFTGSAPAWLWNITHEFKSFGMTKFAGLENVPHYILRYFSHELLYILGLRRRFFHAENYMYFVFGALGILYLCIFLNWFYRNRKDILRLLLFKFSCPGILVVPIFLISVMYLLSTYAGLKSQRYILPLYSAFPVIIGYGLNKLRMRARSLYLFCILLMLFTNIHENVRLYKYFSQPEALAPSYLYPMKSLINFLRSKSISRAYGSQYWLTPRLSFESNEEVICAEPFQEVVPGYLAEVDSARSPAIITRVGEKDWMETALQSAGGSYREQTIGKFVVFYDFSPPASVYEELGTKKWRAKSNFNSGASSCAFDRDFETRWTTWDYQKPGMYYELDMGEVKEISKLTLLTCRSDSPRGFSIEVSVDGEKWSEISNVGYCAGSIFWSGPHLFWKTRPQRIDIVFPPCPSRYLRITQTNQSDTSWWSISEIFVFSSRSRYTTTYLLSPITVTPLLNLPLSPFNKGGRKIEVVCEEKENYELAGIVEFLKKYSIRYVYADEWLSARLDKEMGDNIATVHTDRERDWYNELFPKSPLSRLIKFGNDSVLISDMVHCQSLSASLERLNIGHEVRAIGDYRVYYNFKVPVLGQVPSLRVGATLAVAHERKGSESIFSSEVNSSSWKAFASDNEIDAGKGIDGNISTRWMSGMAQKAGMYYGLNLGKRCRVTGIELKLGQWMKDYPRGYEVEVSDDGEEWTEAETVYIGMYYWSGFNVLSMGQDSGSVKIMLSEPADAQYIKIRQTQSDRVYYWSIAEIKIFE